MFNQFKVGDFVECVDNDDGMVSFLTKGKLYEIMSIPNSTGVEIYNDYGSRSVASGDRFKLVDVVTHINPNHYEQGIVSAKQTIDYLNRMHQETKSEPSVGVKRDNGKPNMCYIPYEALEEIAKVLDYGAIKYSPWNWKKGISFNRLLSATMRHLGQYNSGQDVDDETKISHLAHAACNLMFLLYFEKHRKDLDDRGFKKDDK